MEGIQMLQFNNKNSFDRVYDHGEKVLHLMWALQKQYQDYDKVEFVNLIKKYTQSFIDCYDQELQSDYYEQLKDIKPTTDIHGTHLQGYLDVSYDEILQVMGNHLIKPIKMKGYYCKTDVEWHGQFKDGRVFTIYNWKNGENYCGDRGLQLGQIKTWNVGGLDCTAYDDLKTVFEMELGKIIRSAE